MRKAMLVLVGVIVGMIFGGCVATVQAEQEHPLKIWYENENGNYHTLKVVDEETGVNYVVVATELGEGHRSVSITPRLNPNGSLYVSGNTGNYGYE